MNKKTKRFLVTTLSVATLTCGVIGWATNPDEQKTASAETATTAISLVDGAACRIRTESDTEQGSGIRFKAVLDKTQWTALAESNEMIAGIMILPSDYITAAGGYTHSVLDTAGKGYLDFTYNEDEIGTKTVISASMVDILDQNYTRDFSGVAYLKSTTAFEGATEYGDAYYAYAEYTEENNSRSIYEIATGAYNDRVSAKVTTDYEYSVTYNEKTSYSPYTDEQREVLKGYLDGVVDIKKNAYADVFVTNNTEYYTSPYTIEKRSNAEFIVNYDKSITAKGMLYKGKRVKSLSVKEGKTSISLTDRVVFSQNAGVNADGTVTLAPSKGNANKKEGCFDGNGYGSGVGNYDNNYIGFEGDYGVGTVAEFTFTGNNMPQVLLFANEINGSMGWSDNYGVKDGAGYVIFNGWFTQTVTQNEEGQNVATWHLQKDFLYCYGPYRVSATSQPASATKTNFTYQTGKEYTTLAETLQDGVMYKYYVWSEVNTSGTVDIRVRLDNAEDDTVVVDGTFATGKTEEFVNALGGNIIAYAGVKGEGVSTTFSYEMPYELPELTISASGATVDVNGSVTLEGIRPVNEEYSNGVKSSYVAFDGKYGVGTYIDVEFKGNNMPYVTFFADGIDGYIGGNASTHKGVILMNGMVTAGNGAGVDTDIHTDRLQIWGPNRYKGSVISAEISTDDPWVDDGYSNATSGASWSTGGLLAEITDFAPLTQDGLRSDAYKNMTFRYIVGTVLRGTNVCVRIELYNAKTNERLYANTIETGLQESDIEAGNIILFASAKGLNQNTTFSYSNPYKKAIETEAEEAETVLYNGVTFNADGSVTLTGKEALTAGWSSGLHAMDNSYIAYDGEYILGTEVAFTFKGNNLPQVMLFADTINGDMSKLGGAGILLMNGLYAGSSYVGENVLACFGPNRVFDNYSDLVNNRLSQYNVLVSFESGYEWVMPDENTSYKYVVWTEEVDGKIVVCVELYNAVTSVLLSKGSYATGVGVNDIAAGAIVAYAAVKGNGNNTTFFCHEPKMHENTMNFYTYGAPGTYDTETDLATEAALKDYVDSGMNTMVLAGGNGFTGETDWASSKTKSVMDMARTLGIQKFIINDARLNAGLCIEGSLIGDGCKFASESALDTYVASCVDDYVTEEGFYGVILRDEPSYKYATSMGQLYRSIKRVAEAMNTEIYIQINLLPMDVAMQANYMAETTDSLYADYKSYVSLFLETTGTDLICVDKYPFMPSAFNRNYYSTYKALAEACDEYGAEFGFVLQSYTSENVRKVSQAEMNLQMNAALAFGAKEISFYSYVPHPTEVTESVYDYSFVDLQGNKTEVYTYAQNAIADAKEVEKLLADYEYRGTQMTNNGRDTEFVNDTFEKMTYTSSDKSSSLSQYTNWTVATEAYNDVTDTYLYTVINANAYSEVDVEVTLTFTSYTQAYVVIDGVGSVVDLTNGAYTATLALGEAVYIIPLA
ncbi:MAG: hypothetical protein IJZ32_06135 [Clostridia bacterium]|nr:hypothetical protein [Clostridia bacterium]